MPPLLRHLSQTFTESVNIAAFAKAPIADAHEVSNTEGACVSCLKSQKPYRGPAYSLVPLQLAHTSAACAHAAQSLIFS